MAHAGGSDPSKDAVVVIDLATVEYVEHHDTERWIVVHSTAGERLGAAKVAQVEPIGDLAGLLDGTDEVDTEQLALREARFVALDDALERTRLLRDTPDATQVSARVALYNPVSGEVSVGTAMDGQVYRTSGPLSLDPAGTVGHIEPGGNQLTVAGQTLARREEDRLGDVLASLATYST